MLRGITCVPEDTVPLPLLFPEPVSASWPRPFKVPFLCSTVATQGKAGASWADQVMTKRESQNALRDAGCSRQETWGTVTQQGAGTAAVLVSQARVLTHSPSIYWTPRCLQQHVISLNHMLYTHRLSCWKKHALVLLQRPLNQWASVHVVLRTASSQEWKLSLKPGPHPLAPRPTPTANCSGACCYLWCPLPNHKERRMPGGQLQFYSTTFVFQAHRATLEHNSHLLSLSWKDLTANILLLYMTLICSWTLSTITG